MTTDEELRQRFKAAAHTMRQPEPSLRRTEEAALREPLDKAVNEAMRDAAAKWEESHPMPALPRMPRWPGRRRRRVMDERHRLRMKYKFSADRQRFITAAEKAAREEFRTAYSQTHGADIEALIRGAQERAEVAAQKWSEWRTARKAAAKEMSTIVKTFRSRDLSVYSIAQYLDTDMWEIEIHLGLPLRPSRSWRRS